MKRLALLASLALPLTLTAEDWPQFQGPNRDGTSTETGLAKIFPPAGPKVLWEVALEPGFGGAAVVGDEVFLCDRVQQERDILLCLDFATGKEKWRFEHDMAGEPSHPGSRNVPTVTKDSVYFVASFGDVFCLDRTSHQPRWHVRLDERYPDAATPKWGYAQAALLVDGLVIVTPLGSETGVVALDAKTGKEAWRSGPVGDTHSTPTVLRLCGEDQVVLVTRDGDRGLLTSYRPEDGKILWQSELYLNRHPIPVPTKIDESRLFVTGGYDAGSKMLSLRKSGDRYEVTELWATTKGSQIHPPHLIDGHLYFLANENSNHKGSAMRKTGGLSCWTLDGKELWNTGAEPFMGRGSMIVADGMLIIQDGENGMLRLVDPDPFGFKLLAEANVFGTDPASRKDLKYWTPLALSQGRLLARGQTRLLCLDLRK